MQGELSHFIDDEGMDDIARAMPTKSKPKRRCRICGFSLADINPGDICLRGHGNEPVTPYKNMVTERGVPFPNGQQGEVTTPVCPVIEGMGMGWGHQRGFGQAFEGS